MSARSPRIDDDVGDLKERWDGDDYTAAEIVRDSPNPIAALAGDYRKLGEMAASTQSALDNARPAKWEGFAADAYADYIRDLQSYLATVGQATSSAASACRGCQDAVDSARDDAAAAAARCNHARRRAKQLEDHMSKVSLPTWSALGDVMHEIGEEMRQGLEAGRNARQAVHDAYTRLIAALDPLDNVLATQDTPRLPGPAVSIGRGGVQPANTDENELLMAIFASLTNGDINGQSAQSTAFVDRYRQAMRDDPSGKKARDVLAEAADTLSADELEYLFDHVDETDVATTFGALDPTKDRDLYNKLAAKLPLDVLNRLADTDPNHYWHPAAGGDPYVWKATDGQAGVVPGADLQQLHQGSLGDCYYMAALGAVTKADPNFLRNHVVANPNGTYTVTLYKDGKPIQVTVTPEVPWSVDANGNPVAPAYARGDRNLFQIYEKAMAQVQGELQPEPGTGYYGMGDGGNPATYMSVITGQPASRASGFVLPVQLDHALKDHRPVTVSTEGGRTSGPYDPNRVPHLIGGHAYYVQSVNMDAHPPTVTLVNPWGPDSKTDGTVTLRWDEFQNSIAEVEVGR